MRWQLAEAKNKFTEVVNRALTEGPQRVTRRKDEVVVVSAAEFDRLAGREPSFVQFLLSGPRLTEEEIEVMAVVRGSGPDRGPGREIDFGKDDN